jgi:hypothetical protein
MPQTHSVIKGGRAWAAQAFDHNDRCLASQRSANGMRANARVWKRSFPSRHCSPSSLKQGTPSPVFGASACSISAFLRHLGRRAAGLDRLSAFRRGLEESVSKPSDAKTEISVVGFETQGGTNDFVNFKLQTNGIGVFHQVPWRKKSRQRA